MSDERAAETVFVITGQLFRNVRSGPPERAAILV